MKLRKGKPEEVGMSSQRIRHVSDLARGWAADGKTPSLVILAARRGVIVLHEAFGTMGPESDSPPLKKDTIFPLASITKVITATAIMILVEDGLLSLNRPVTEYFPDFEGKNKEKVMLHHLLTHTSGLNQEEIDKHAAKKKASVEIPPPDGDIHPENHELLFLECDAPLWKDPGEEMAYCNFNFVILGEIIRREASKSLEDFAYERIFEPLGMKDSYYVLPESLEGKVVQRPMDAPYAEYLESLKKVPRGSSGVFSTAEDIAIFGQMFLNEGAYNGNRILSPSSVREMTRNQIPGVLARFDDEIIPEAGWSLGWGIQENKKSLQFGSLWSQDTYKHSGAGGVSIWVDPIYEIVGVYFSVELESRADGGHKWNLDLFANAVTASIIE
jgi:CubicO group peptidase (beta-lactamase class C family)